MSIEDEFHEAMLDGYRRTGAETGYWAGYFNRDVLHNGGLAIAKKLLTMSTREGPPSKGLQALIDHGRADLSVEALVLSVKFRSLFTDEELRTAQTRLNAIPSHGFRRRVPAAEIRIEDMRNDLPYREGAVQTVTVNSYERNEAARKACIQKHGARCAVCEMTFSKVYGEIGEGFIHVHHVKPLAAIRVEYELVPAKDLVPVCPNCHAMLHTHDPPLSIVELRRIISDRR